MDIKFPAVLDGATGSELMKKGLPAGECQEKWIIDNPQAIYALQHEYEEAGSNLVLAPTFGAIAHKLSAFGLSENTEEINRELVAISKKAVSESVLVAADVTASGLFLAPYGDETMESLVERYSEQLCGCEAADVVVSETNMSIADARAAVIAAKKLYDKPVFVTFTVDENGRTMMGADASAALVIFRSLGVSAFGFNCGFGPREMLGVISSLDEVRGNLPLIAKPNAGLPQMIDGKEMYSMEPCELASYAQDFADAGVRLFGGCCGTNPAHIRALSEAVAKVSFKEEKREEREFLANERAYIAVEDVVLSDEIACSELLADDLMCCMDVCPLVRISTPEDVSVFEENQNMAQLPICIACDDSDLLSDALLSYNGRAGIKSTCPDAENVAKFYGAYIIRG